MLHRHSNLVSSAGLDGNLDVRRTVVCFQHVIVRYGLFLLVRFVDALTLRCLSSINQLRTVPVDVKVVPQPMHDTCDGRLGRELLLKVVFGLYVAKTMIPDVSLSSR